MLPVVKEETLHGIAESLKQSIQKNNSSYFGPLLKRLEIENPVILDKIWQLVNETEDMLGRTAADRVFAGTLMVYDLLRVQDEINELET